MRAITSATLFLLSSPAMACANTMHDGETNLAPVIFGVAAVASGLLFLGAIGMAATAGFLMWSRS